MARTDGAHRAPIIAAALAGLALCATPAFAHTAAVTCDPGGQYVVTTTFNELSPTWEFTPTTVIVTWTDGFLVERSLPVPCEAPPVIPPPVVVPPTTLAPPPVVVPPPRARTPKPHARTHPLTCEILKARGAGRGWYVRLGIPYYRCHVAVGPPFGPHRPFRGVAG